MNWPTFSLPRSVLEDWHRMFFVPAHQEYLRASFPTQHLHCLSEYSLLPPPFWLLLQYSEFGTCLWWKKKIYKTDIYKSNTCRYIISQFNKTLWLCSIHTGTYFILININYIQTASWSDQYVKIYHTRHWTDSEIHFIHIIIYTWIAFLKFCMD